MQLSAASQRRGPALPSLAGCRALSGWRGLLVCASVGGVLWHVAMDSSERSRRLADSPLGGMPGDGLGPARRLRARRLAADERRFLPPSEHRPSPPHERWRLLVRGRVQGVGYRAGCSRRAHELGIGGWVRNRADGCVEVEAEGTPQQLTEFRLWCERGPLMAQVSGVESTQIPGRGDDWFEIRI